MSNVLFEPRCKGSQVNPVAGACILGGKNDLDFVVDGPLPLHWQRSYRSTNDHIGWFGRGWGSSLEVFLEAYPDGRSLTVDHVDYVDPFGRHVTFPSLQPGNRSYSPFERLTLRRSADGQYSIETVTGITYAFGDRADGRHELESVSDRNGNQIRLSRRSVNGELFSIALACSGGQQLQLLFDRRCLAEVSELRTKPVRLARYRYSTRGDLTRVLNRLDEEIRIFEYNDDRLLSRHVYAGLFEAHYEYTGRGKDSRVVRSRNSFGQSWTFVYRNDQTEVVDHMGRVTRYHIDAERRWTGYTDAAGGVTRRGLDRYNNVRAMIDPAGLITEAKFDERGNPVELRDAAGAVTTVEWHSELALPVRVTDALSRSTAFQYDERGNLIETTASDGATTRHRVDERGLVTEIEDAKGGTKKQVFNARGQLVSYTDCSNRTTTLAYNQDGQVVSVTDPLGQVTTMAYDALGRMRRHVLADGSAEEYEYDRAGRVASVTNSLQVTTQFRYTEDGLIKERIDGLGQRLLYQYDSRRMLAALVNENGDSYRFEYDALDRVVSEERFDKTVTRYSYDLSGYLVETIEAPGHADAIITRYRRDPLGRLLERISATSRALFNYDKMGQVVLAQNADTTVQFAYDKRGRLEEERVTIGSIQHDLKYEYDELGHRIKTVLPDGTTVARNTYGSGHTRHISCDGATVCHIERDALHREVARTQGQLISRREYDPVGRLSRQWSFLPDGSPTEGEANAGVVVERRYKYDLAGRLVESIDRGRLYRYEYDAIDRLTRFNDEVYAFDPAHNLVDIHQSGHSVGVRGNRITVHQDRRYRYDVHGRVVEKRVGAERVISLKWDDEHHLVQATTSVSSVGRTVRYMYDPFGRRVSKLGEDSARLFVWEGNRLVQQHDAKGVLTFIYEPVSFVPLAQVFKRRAEPAKAEVLYYHCTQVGLPRELTDETGRIVWEAEFSGWGRRTKELGTGVQQPLRYQGQYYDDETGLHYNRYRYYDPDIGRFVSPDPIGLFGSENLYEYAVNPITWMDPLGLAKFTPKKKALILAENEQFHGQHTCEKCKCALVRPKKSMSGETPPQNEWQIDHIDPESSGGPATEINGQVLCRQCNREDWDKPKPNYKEQNREAAEDEGECE
jgi:RHS repeat-associated protein